MFGITEPLNLLIPVPKYEIGQFFYYKNLVASMMLLQNMPIWYALLELLIKLAFTLTRFDLI